MLAIHTPNDEEVMDRALEIFWKFRIYLYRFCAKTWGFVIKCNISGFCPKYRKKSDLSYLNALERELVDYFTFFFPFYLSFIGFTSAASYLLKRYS